MFDIRLQQAVNDPNCTSKHANWLVLWGCAWRFTRRLCQPHPAGRYMVGMEQVLMDCAKYNGFDMISGPTAGRAQPKIPTWAYPDPSLVPPLVSPGMVRPGVTIPAWSVMDSQSGSNQANQALGTALRPLSAHSPSTVPYRRALAVAL